MVSRNRIGCSWDLVIWVLLLVVSIPGRVVVMVDGQNASNSNFICAGKDVSAADAKAFEAWKKEQTGLNLGTVGKGTCNQTVPYAAYNLTTLNTGCFFATPFATGLCVIGPYVGVWNVGICLCQPIEVLTTKAPTSTPTEFTVPTVKPTVFVSTLQPTFAPSMAPTSSPTQVPVPAVSITNVLVNYAPDVKLFPLRENHQEGVGDGSGDGVLEEEKGSRNLLSQEELDYRKVYDINFEIGFRCYFAYLLLQKLKSGNGLEDVTIRFDASMLLQPSDSIGEFMPVLDYNRTCIAKALAEQNATLRQPCPVDFSIQATLTSPSPTFSPTSRHPSSSPVVTTLKPTGGPTLPSATVGPPTQSPSTKPTAPPTRIRTIQVEDFFEELFAGLEGSKDKDRLYWYNTGYWSISRKNIKGNKTESTVGVRQGTSINRSYVIKYPHDVVETLRNFKIDQCPQAYFNRTYLLPFQRETGHGTDLALVVGLPLIVTFLTCFFIGYLWSIDCFRSMLLMGTVDVDDKLMKNKNSPLDDDDVHGSGLKPDMQQLFRDLEIDVLQLKLGPVIGHGANGRIFKALYCGSDVAVKELFPSVFEPNFAMNDDFAYDIGTQEHHQQQELLIDPKDQVWREVQNLRRLRHPHVIQLYGCSQALSSDTGQLRFLVVMELASCSLRDLLRSDPYEDNPDLPFTLEEFDLPRKLNFTKEVCAGLAYIHDCNLIHFDIKPENILLNQAGQAKICDLGIAKLHGGPNQTINVTLSAMGGTPPYMAPELLRGSMDEVTFGVDVYAFSIVLWQIFHPNEFPHPTNWTVAKLFHEVMMYDYRPTIDESVDGSIANLMRRCWDTDFRLRPSFREIIPSLTEIQKHLCGNIFARNRRSSEEDIDFIQVGASIFLFEHSMRTYIPCEVEETNYDEDTEQRVLDVKIIPPSPSFDYDDEVDGDDENIDKSLDQQQQQNVLMLAEEEEEKKGGDLTIESQHLPEKQEKISKYEMMMTIATGSDEESFYSRVDVPERFFKIRLEDWLVDTGEGHVIFDSIAQLSHLRSISLLECNSGLLQTMKTTNVTKRDRNLQADDITLLFEDELNQHDRDLIRASSLETFSHQGSFDSLSMMVSPGGTGLADSPLFQQAIENAVFETDKMSIVKFADLSVYRRRRQATSFCSVGIHLPTFTIMCVKQIQLASHSLIKEGIVQVMENWREISGLPSPTVSVDGGKSEGFSPSLGAILKARTGEFEPCPYLTKFYGCYFDPNEQSLTIITEYMDGGSLQNLLDANYVPVYDHDDTFDWIQIDLEEDDVGEDDEVGFANGGGSIDDEPKYELHRNCIINETLLSRIAESLLIALNFLHEKRRSHGGVKPANVLINTKGQVKLSGFGLNGNWRANSRPVFGHEMPYQSPELLQGEPGTPASDVWSFGMTLLSVALGHHPFSHTLQSMAHSKRLMTKYLLRSLAKYTPLRMPSTVPFPPPKGYPCRYETSFSFSPQFTDFITSCLRFDAPERPHVSELLRHPFITGAVQNGPQLLASPTNYQLHKTKSLTRAIHVESMERLVSDITNALLQRVVGNIQSRKYLVLSDDDDSRLIIRNECLQRLGTALGLSENSVRCSFIYNADARDITVTHVEDINNDSTNIQNCEKEKGDDEDDNYDECGSASPNSFGIYIVDPDAKASDNDSASVDSGSLPVLSLKIDD